MAVRAKRAPESYGKMVSDARPFDAPFSREMERIERRIGGVFDENGVPLIEGTESNPARDEFYAKVLDNPPSEISLRGAYSGEVRKLHGSAVVARVGENSAQAIPADLLASYRLCEYYPITEGDVRQTIQLPLEVAVRPLVVEDGDPEVGETLTELFGPDYLDLDAVIADMWQSVEVYGAAYPYEIWSGRLPSAVDLTAMMRGEKTPAVLYPQSAYCLNPKFIYVGQQVFSNTSLLSIMPGSDDTAQFRQMLLDGDVPPMTYNAISSDIHEHLQWAWDIPLDPSACTQIRDQGMSFLRYPWPSLQSCFRTLSTRQVLEEMIRATIEGTKNQLWAFLLGDPKGETRPTADEIRALTAAVGGLAGRRTGSLVWGGSLRVEVFGPKVEDALANGKWQSLTEHFFRQRGISMGIISGENTSTSGANGGTTDGIDVKVFIERMTYKRGRIERWLKRYVRRVCLLSGDPGLVKRALANDLPSVKLGDFGIQTDNEIKNKIMPYYATGLLSPQTALAKGGMNYDQELANHKSADKDELQPPATYAQAVVSPGGQKTVSKSSGAKGEGGAKRTTSSRSRRTGTGGERGKAD